MSSICVLNVIFLCVVECPHLPPICKWSTSEYFDFFSWLRFIDLEPVRGHSSAKTDVEGIWFEDS